MKQVAFVLSSSLYFLNGGNSFVPVSGHFSA